MASSGCLSASPLSKGSPTFHLSSFQMKVRLSWYIGFYSRLEDGHWNHTKIRYYLRNFSLCPMLKLAEISSLTRHTCRLFEYPLFSRITFGLLQAPLVPLAIDLVHPWTFGRVSSLALLFLTFALRISFSRVDDLLLQRVLHLKQPLKHR